MWNVTYDRMSLDLSYCFLRAFSKAAMTAGHDFLDSEFDAVALHEIDFLQPKVEDCTLSQICGNIENGKLYIQ